MEVAISSFEWDEENRAGCQQHGVSVRDIEMLLRRGPRVAPVAKRIAGGERFIAVGKTDLGQPLFVAFSVLRKGTRLLVRPLAARPMTAQESERYEASA